MNAQSKNLSSKSTQNEKGHHFYVNSNPSIKINECCVIVEDVRKDRTYSNDKVKKPYLKAKACSVVLHDVLKKKESSCLPNIDLGKGSKVNIFKCKSPRCNLSHQFLARDKAISSCMKRAYDYCITPPGTVYVDCHSTKVIYLITYLFNMWAAVCW